MLNRLLEKYKNSKGLLKYFFLTYIDKIISFALPISILFILKDKELYNFVEVSFSYATLAMIVFEIGVSNYLFFGYKKSENKDLFVKDAQLHFKFLLLTYFLVSIPLIISLNFFNSHLLIMFVLVGIRTLFTLYTNFYSSIYRLNDTPSKIYITTIIVNVSSFLLLMISTYFSFQYKIIYFFLPSLILVLLTCIKFVFSEISKFHFNDFKLFIFHSLNFSWPIIINVLAMGYVNNYAKIYAYGNLSQDETLQISYIMRIGLIIQLTHSSFASFFSKSLFMDLSNKFNTDIFKKYNFVLLFSMILVSMIILFTNFFFQSYIHIPFTISTFLFIFYIILWCYIGYLELYFGVMNANKKILFYSVVSTVVYILLLNLFDKISILQLSIFMVISAMLNLAMVIFGLYSLKIFNTKLKSNDGN